MKRRNQHKNLSLLQAKRFRRKLRFKSYLKRKNIRKNRPKKDRPKIIRLEDFKGYIQYRAPSNLSFINNAEEFVAMVNTLNRINDSLRPTFLNLSRVQQISHDAIPVLTSLAIKSIKDFGGNFPSSLECRSFLLKSGYFRILRQKDFIIKSDVIYLGKKDIFTLSSKEVKSGAANELFKIISNAIWGQERRMMRLYGMLMDLMENTEAHADPNNAGSENWWLTIKVDIKNREAYFAFMDHGVGIIESLKTKPESNLMKKWLETMKASLKSNIEIINSMLDGEHKSRTGLPNRGKGIPELKRSYSRNFIKNLVIITNDVYIDLDKSIDKRVNPSFSGTFINWKIDQSCLPVT